MADARPSDAASFRRVASVADSRHPKLLRLVPRALAPLPMVAGCSSDASAPGAVGPEVETEGKRVAGAATAYDKQSRAIAWTSGFRDVTGCGGNARVQRCALLSLE